MPARSACGRGTVDTRVDQATGVAEPEAFKFSLIAAAMAGARSPAITCQTFSDAFITLPAPALWTASWSALPVSRSTNRNRVTATCSAF